MDTERKIYGLLETVEQQQKSLAVAAEALDQTRHAIGLLVEEVQEAAATGASAGAAHSLEQAGLVIAEAAKPTIAELKQVAASAAQVQYQFQKAAAWATWKHFALIAGGCLTLLLGVWIAVAAQRAELTELKDQKAALEGEIVTLQSTVAELARQGGRIKFNVCGKDQRKCVKVNMGMGTFGKGGENYMILDGY
jgi:hypothetical protein